MQGSIILAWDAATINEIHTNEIPLQEKQMCCRLMNSLSHLKLIAISEALRPIKRSLHAWFTVSLHACFNGIWHLRQYYNLVCIIVSLYHCIIVSQPKNSESDILQRSYINTTSSVITNMLKCMLYKKPFL